MNEKRPASRRSEHAHAVASELLVRLKTAVEHARGELSINAWFELSTEITDCWRDASELEDSLLNKIYNFANHYLSDADIIHSSPEYAKTMNEQLRQYLSDLKL